MSKPSVLVASVRALLKRTDALEQELKRTKKEVVFNHMAPAFFPSIPPGVHAPAADVQFAAALSHVLCPTEPVSLSAKVFNDETVYDCFMNEPINNTKCLSLHDLPAGLLLPRIAATDNFYLDLKTFDNEHFLQISKNKQYDYGDAETHAVDVDTSDFFIHQFMASDEASEPREVMTTCRMRPTTSLPDP